MRLKRILFLCAMMMICFIPQKYAFAQSDESAIKQVLMNQVSDWNKGDIKSFMDSYQNSPQTIFIGETVRQGWQQVFERYKKSIPPKKKWGHSHFQI